MRAFVASDDPSLAHQLREALTRLGHDCPASQIFPLEAAGARLASQSTRTDGGSPDLVFVIVTPDPERALPVAGELRRISHSPLLAVGPATDPKLLLRTLREGAQEYLDQANLSDELAAALSRLRTDTNAGRGAGRVVSLVAAAGGSGSSTLAVNVAASLAKSAGSCILLDLNPESGDLAPLLDLKPTYTVADLCRSVSRLDRSLLEAAVVPHESGIRLLAAPSTIADAAAVTAEGVGRILSLSVELAPFIVADLGRGFRREPMQAIAQSDEVWLVLRLDFTSLRNARRLLVHFQEAGLNVEQIRIAVNRYRQAGEIPLSEAEEALGIKVAKFVIDDAKAVNRSNNNGTPAVLGSPSAKVSVQMADIASAVRGAARR